MRIDRITNNKTGVTYLYEVENVYDPEKKRTVAKRKCIGKLDPETNEVVPTGKRGRPKKQPDTQREAAPAPESISDEIRDRKEEIAALQAELTRLRAESEKMEKLLQAIAGAISGFTDGMGSDSSSDTDSE